MTKESQLHRHSWQAAQDYAVTAKTKKRHDIMRTNMNRYVKRVIKETKPRNVHIIIKC